MTRDSKRINGKGEFTDYMSAEELKSRFYDHFRNTGTLADLRSQLRSKLVNEMFKVASSPNETDSNDDAGDPLLPLQIGNWLVYDHMKRLGMEYSLSTFVSEANLPYPKKLLSIKDILHIFGIESHLPEYKLILSAYASNSKEGFLYIFISTLIKKTVRDDTKDLISQAEVVKSRGDTKHFSLADYYPSKVFDETFNDFQSPFKEAVPNTEAIAYKQLQQEKDRHEKEIKQLRQKLLTELDTLYTHEQEARMEIERKKMKLVNEQELMNLQKEKLKMKELEFESRAKSLQLESEARANSLKESLLQKKKELDEKESILNEMQQRFVKEQAELKAKEILTDASETRFTQLQKSYKTLQDEYTAILNENGRFQMELKQMSDYSPIKEELIWKSNKLEHVEKELMLLRSQLHQERLLSLQSMQRFQQQIVNEASMQHLAGQNISNGLVDPLVKNKEESQEPVNQSSQQYKELLTKIEDQRQDIQELHRLIHNLHYQPFSKQDQATSTGPLQTKESGMTSPKDTLSRKSSNQSLLQQKLYQETNRRIEELIKETDAMERKYSEYMFGRPILYPNIYLPYNSTTTPLHLEATKLPLTNDNSSFQNFHSSFRNFDLKFGSAADYDSKISDRILLSTCPGDQERSHHMQKFLDLLHWDVTSNPTYGMDSKFESHLNANQTFSDPFSNKSASDNFTSRNNIDEASTDRQKLFPDTVKSGTARLDGVKRDNTSTLLQPKHDTSHSQIMQESSLIVGSSPRAADSNVDPASDVLFPTTGSKVEDTSSIQQNHENNEMMEERNTVSSNEVKGSKLPDGNKEDSRGHPLQSPTMQMKHDSIYKLDNGAYELKKLVSSTSLEPVPTSKETNNSIVEDLPIDLDAVWKQQTSKPKEYIFKINSTNINTLGLNEVKSANSKNLVDPRDTVKRKLSFNENPSQDSNSLLNLTSLNGASRLSPISKTTSILNSTLDKNTLKLNSAAETDQPFVDLSEAVSLKNSVSGMTTSQLNLASEKDTLHETSVLGEAAPLLNTASLPRKDASTLNLISEKDVPSLNPASLSEKAAAPLNLVSEKDAISLNEDSFSEKAASPLNPLSAKDESPLNQASLSEKAESPLNPVSEKDESPLNEASLSEKAAPSLNSVLEMDLPQQKSNVELEQDKGLSQKSSESPKSESNSSPHDTNAKRKSSSLEQQASILNLTSVEQPTPESIQVEERRTTVDEQAPGSQKYDEPSPLHELEARNSVSEISSGELDEKDSSNANASELSELNLSAGSELEQTKDDEDEDGW